MLNWLASYPKSGNTWVRLFLDAYVFDEEPDINAIKSTRPDQDILFYNTGDFDIMDYDMKFQPLARGMMLLRMDKMYKGGFIGEDMTLPVIIKTHLANANVNGVEMIPRILTENVVTIVRDPRDVVQSYARHMRIPIEEAVDIIISDDHALHDLSKDENRLPQNMMSWKMHVQSYVTAKELQVYAVRYEDLIDDPVKNFSFVLEGFGLPIDEDRVKRAIERCSLAKMKKQEDTEGFREKPEGADRFFGGKTKEKLPEQLEKKIIDHAGDMMKAFSYI